MGYRDLRHFIETLESKGELKRIAIPVSPILEVTEWADRAVKSRSGGPALLFEKVEGSNVPILINTYATHARMALALGVPSLSALTAKMEDLLGPALHPPTGGLWEKLKLLPKLLEYSAAIPKSVSSGPVKEVVDKETPSFERFPVIQCWPQDAGKYITFGCVFTKDPESGKRNCGVYRLQLFDARTCAMHWHPHKDGARHFGKSKQAGRRMEAAIVVGPDPAVAFAAVCPLPPDIDEMMIAGLLAGEAVRMVKCETVDIEVPANAEIVFEGYIDPDETRVEGPFGDHTGYYSLADRFPVFHLTCVTHRRDPIYQTTIVGRPPMEDGAMGYAIERLFLPLLRMQIPEVIDMHMPLEGCFHNLVLVSIRKRYPGQARKVMHAIWGMGQAMFTKVIVVLDEDVNVQDPREVCWKALNHIDPERDIEFAHGPMDILDHASRASCYGSKMGVDATRKLPEEGHTRPWPDEIVMTPQVKALVERKWREVFDRDES